MGGEIVLGLFVVLFVIVAGIDWALESAWRSWRRAHPRPGPPSGWHPAAGPPVRRCRGPYDQDADG